MLLRRPDSLSITFTGPGQVTVERERLRRPRRGEALLTALCSLISVGTERRALDRDFGSGAHRERWVTYPFRPGYSFVGTTEPGSRVCAHAPHAQREVMAQTGGEGAAVVFDVTGDGSVLAAALRLARTRGTVVVLGDAADPSVQRLGPELLLEGLRIVGVHSNHATLGERRRMAADPKRLGVLFDWGRP